MTAVYAEKPYKILIFACSSNRSHGNLNRPGYSGDSRV
jgi:hypothetical protein